MSATAAAILEQIQGLPRPEQEAVFQALTAERQRKGVARRPVKPGPPAPDWARRRSEELERIYGKTPRPNSMDVLDDIRADRI
jgi:hypothetical protein